MKKILIFLFVSLVYLNTYSQTVIDNPIVGINTAGNIKLTKVTLSDKATILSFTVKYKPGNWIRIPAKTYIQELNGADKLYIKKTKGIGLDDKYTMPKSGEVSYDLIFPPISKNTSYIDYGETGGTWFIYDIVVNPSLNKRSLPEDMYGNWFNTITGIWDLSITNKYVVYKSQLWSYDSLKTGSNFNELNLTNSNGKSIVLHFKAENTGTCMFGEMPNELKLYTKNRKEAKSIALNDDKPFELPVFKLDSATYSGYIKDYTPRIGVKTLSISIDNIITGNQTSNLIKIDENGYFMVKVPIYYPSTCWVRSSIFNGSVFLEPGKDLFQILQIAPLFMGESSRINTELTKLEKIRIDNYEERQRVILDMTPIQYKTYCKNIESIELNALDSVTKTDNISAKAYQVNKMNIEYRTMSEMMNYDSNYESAYRKKNKIPRSQRTLPIKTDSLTADYFNFINNENTNSPLAVIATNYESFINRLKYLDILRTGSSFSLNTTMLANELEKSGYSLTVNEKLMIESIAKVDSIHNLPEQKEFYKKYGKRIADLYLKYKEPMNEYNSANKNVDFSAIEKYFIDQKINVTDDEKELLKAIDEHGNSEIMKNSKELVKPYRDSISVFFKNHNSFIDELFTQKGNDARNENLNKLLGVETGFASDLMYAQDKCRKIVEEVSPLTDNQLQAIQKHIITPFIANYIALCNNQSIAKLEANKEKKGFVVNEVPKTEADKVFDAIMQKYKGKVVYVDFWATWCGPCRSGIERIKPLKEEMAGKDVVFVYITNQTSPQNTYSNMIPDIKGEHYRVSEDEWNYLKEKFNISGIPHCILVGKNGKVLNPKLGYLDNEMLKSLLEKHITE